MPKRKRPSPPPSPPNDEGSPDRTLKRQKKLCTQRIASAQKPLVAALRLAAGFERQKYSRRRKTAKQKNNEKGAARLDAEYAILKGLDIAKLGEQHLRRTIGKVKSLAVHEELPESVKEVEKGGHTPEYLNVTARLYKVPGVRKVVDGVVEDLKGILGVEGGPQKKRKGEEVKREDSPSKKAKLANVEDDEDGSDADTEDDFAAFDARIAAPSSAEEDSDDSLLEGERPPSVIDSDREIEIADEASDADSVEDSEEVVSHNTHLIASEDSYSSASEASELEDDFSPPPKAKSKAKAVTEKATKSTFLPSLSHAGYLSGSESEASDLDIDIAPKKNRRGQRARQKIWEKKYGEKAKHVTKQDRNKGWDPKRGAVSNDRGGRGVKGDRRGKESKGGKEGRGGAPRGMKTGYGPQKSGGNMTELGPKKTKRDDAGTLHPSWAAAKAAKEKKIDVKPQGKKITFE